VAPAAPAAAPAAVAAPIAALLLLLLVLTFRLQSPLLNKSQSSLRARFELLKVRTLFFFMYTPSPRPCSLPLLLTAP